MFFSICDNDKEIKRIEAIEEVSDKLRIYAQFMKYGILQIEDRIKGTSTSLIKINNQISNNSTLEKSIIEAIIDQEKEINFVKQYTDIINNLDDIEKEVIIKRYLKQYTFKKIIEGSPTELCRSHPELYLERAYIQIAILDNSINYTIQDEAMFQKEKLYQNECKNKNKKLALLYLDKLKYKDQYDEEIIEEIEESLNSIPEKERNLLYKFIFKSKDTTFTRVEYFQLKRAIHSFIFLYPKFEYTEKAYLEDMKKTKGGWKQVFEHVVLEKNIKTVFEFSTYRKSSRKE